MESLDEIGIRYDITNNLGSGDKSSRVNSGGIYVIEDVLMNHPTNYKQVKS